MSRNPHDINHGAFGTLPPPPHEHDVSCAFGNPKCPAFAEPGGRPEWVNSKTQKAEPPLTRRKFFGWLRAIFRS